MRFAIPFLVVCAALVCSVLVLGAFARPPEVGPLPDLTLRDPAGQSVDLSAMDFSTRSLPQASHSSIDANSPSPSAS